MIKIAEVKKAFKNVREKLEEERAYLNQLDSELGDSDHGESVTKAFSRVDEVAEGYQGDDIGQLFGEIARSIISFGGAAMGPLYGTAFLRASQQIKGKQELKLKDLQNILAAMEQGIKDRGKVEVGDKTMLDTLHPAAEAIRGHDDLEQAIEETVAAARAGMEATKEMKAKIGRSSRLGDRSIGYIDPGSTSMYYVIKEFLETF